MKYNRLHINHFGKLQNRTLEFTDGINVIYGPNESGKSTLHAFLETMLFGMERGRGKSASHDLYSHYYPEGGSSTYGGVLEFSQHDHLYSIYRNFKKDPKGYTLMDESTNRQLSLTEEEYHKLLSHMTLPLYRNTVSLRQLQAATSRDFPEQLRSHIVNLRTAGSAALDLTRTRNRLKKDRKQMEQGFSKEAEAQAAALDGKIRELMEQQDHFPDSGEITLWEEERRHIQADMEELKLHHAELIRQIHVQEEALGRGSSSDNRGENSPSDRFWRLLARRDSLVEEYGEPLGAPYRNLLPIFSLLLPVLSVLALLFGVFFFTRSELFSGIFALVAAAIFFLLGRSAQGHRKHLKAFLPVDQSLRKLYQEVFGESISDVTQDHLQKLMGAMDDWKDQSRQVEKNRRESEAMMEKIFRLQDNYNRLTGRLEEKKKESWQKTQLNEQIRELEEQREALEDALQKNLRMKEEMAAIDLALATIDELSVTAFDSFGSYLQTKASELISQITCGRYQRILMDDDLNITLEKDHVPVDLKSISCSTLDQVYLSLRIACIDFFWPNDAVPILLDESFAMYDSERIAETLSWLAESYPGQVFLFTCQHREEEIMQQANIKYQTISL